jgi:hypothetical protein
MRQAYIKAPTIQVAVGDFRAAKMLSYIPDFFTEADFLGHTRDQQAARYKEGVNQHSVLAKQLASSRDIVPVLRTVEPVSSISDTWTEWIMGMFLISGYQHKTAITE